jgi:hypothetical protein
LTDGVENASFLDPESTLDAARHSDMITNIIIDAGRRTGLGHDAAQWRAEAAITEATGGRLVVLDRDGDLGAAFLDAIENLRTSYVLSYTVTGVPLKGWHDVTVRVKASGKYEVRTRKGYFAG